MAILVNDPQTFARESLEQYALVNADQIRLVSGGVTRAVATEPGKVAIILGGGSGHFPAFAGWVGIGMAHGAVCGNIFASPSENQVFNVALEAHGDSGVLFLPINYAGDILHFGGAAERLEAAGIPVGIVPITDDIASGDAAHHQERRGIAGALAVVKIVAAAAERGVTLPKLVELANKANEATRTFGVAFSGCTLPGATSPLFTIPDGMMALGLGIHGEPGIAERPLGSANDIASIMVQELMQERPLAVGTRVAVVVNGLGATKYDELYVLYGAVHRLLRQSGIEVVAPAVGEYVTSLDMAGVSITITTLDEELEENWLAPARTPTFQRGQNLYVGQRQHSVTTGSGKTRAHVVQPTRDPLSLARGEQIARILASIAEHLEHQAQHLGDLDSIGGDGDHGLGMARGSRAAAQAAKSACSRHQPASSVLSAAGEAWSDVGGGTSGALWGAGLGAAAAALEVNDDAAVVDIAVREFTERIKARSGASRGDKTMMDALLPFTEEYELARAQQQPPQQAWAAAVRAALSGAKSTADMVAKRGRARTHGDRTLGTPDPGAVSFTMVVQTILDAWTK